MTPAADVVDAFNELGYESTFAAAAAHLRNAAGGQQAPTAQSLYIDYPSKEVLGEVWLSQLVPAANVATLRDAFISVASTLLAAMESRRDFSRAWLAAMKRTGPPHLVQVQRLQAQLQLFFTSWLDVHAADVSLPPNVLLKDVKEDLADALCAVLLWLVMHWESDRSAEYDHTQKLVRSSAYLVDALLVARADFAGAGLLFHLHRLAGEQQQRFVKPLLDMLLPPGRAARLLDPVSLVEILRTLQASPAQRP